jgi:3' terminal RNA ribose 2'-O-methyltransferase Hen1
LDARLPLQQLLSHLYVLVPVLDNDKHYWVGDDEVAKLLRHGEGWLASHPEREAITRRYLKHQRSLVDDALAQLADENAPNPDAEAEAHAQEEEAIEKGISLNEQRLGSVLAALKGLSAARVLDLGCGEGRLLQALLKEKQFTQIVGMDVSHRALEIASDRLHYDRLPPMQKERIRLLHGSLIYRDQRLAGFDAAAVVEVIEHLDAAQRRKILNAFAPVAFLQKDPWLSVNSRLALNPSNASSAKNRFGVCMKQSSACSRWKANRLIHDCKNSTFAGEE